MLSDSDFAMLHTWNVWDVPPVVERQWSGYMARICAVLTNLLCDLEHDDWGSGSRYTIPLAALELWSERDWYLFLLAASRLHSAWSLWNRAPSTVLRTVLWPQREWYLWGGNLYIVRLVASRLWSWCPAPLDASWVRDFCHKCQQCILCMKSTICNPLNRTNAEHRATEITVDINSHNILSKCSSNYVYFLGYKGNILTSKCLFESKLRM